LDGATKAAKAPPDTVPALDHGQPEQLTFVSRRPFLRFAPPRHPATAVAVHAETAQVVNAQLPALLDPRKGGVERPEGRLDA
jgi:hypothetical protein